MVHRHEVHPAVQRALEIPARRDIQLRGVVLLLRRVPRQLSAQARLQIDRLAAFAEREWDMTAPIGRVAEVLDLVKDLVSVTADHRP